MYSNSTHIENMIIIIFALSYPTAMMRKFKGIGVVNDSNIQAPFVTMSDGPSSAITKPVLKEQKD